MIELQRSSSPNVKFGTFEVDLHAREVRKHGMHVRLEEKPFRILELLLERPGKVVTRRALRDSLWPDTHGGYEHSLNTTINTQHKARASCKPSRDRATALSRPWRRPRIRV